MLSNMAYSPHTQRGLTSPSAVHSHVVLPLARCRSRSSRSRLDVQHLATKLVHTLVPTPATAGSQRYPAMRRSATATSTPGPAASDAASPSAEVKALYQGKKAVVVGAGPAGSTAAMFLAQQGFNVEVYERRPEPEEDTVDTGRAYIIILIPRGQAALEKLGVALPDDPRYKTKGTVRHDQKGKIRASKEEGNVTFSRAGLAQYLINQARQRYPNQIKFFFSATCDAIDVPAKKATFTSEVGKTPITTRYDLLVGADGVGSKVRQALKDTIPGYSVDVSDSGREYKVYLNLQGDIEPPDFKGRPGSTLHLWTTPDPFTTVTAHSNPDGSYTGTFSLKTGGWEGLKTQEEYEALLRKEFPSLPQDWIPLIAAQTVTAAPSSAGKRIKVSQLNGPGILLLGDAAHAVTPVFGQGANSALESCLVLDKVLTDAKGDVAAVPELFHKARVDDAHALFDIDQKAYSFFRRRGIFDPDFLQLLSHVALGFILSKIVPQLYGPRPALLGLGSRDTSYSTIMAAVRRDSKAAAVLVASLVVLVVCKFAKVF